MKPVGGRGYALELRERIVRAVEAGGSVYTVAQQFSVHPTTVQRYLDLNQGGRPCSFLSSTTAGVTMTPQPPLRRTRSMIIQMQLDDRACSMLQDAPLMSASFKTVDRVFTRHSITHKKNGGRERTL